MRIRFRKSALAIAAPMGLALSLAACNAEGESANAGADDLPETEIEGDPDAISDPAISEAVPGIDSVDTEGDAPSTAGVDSEEDAEYAEPDEDMGEDPPA